MAFRALFYCAVFVRLSICAEAVLHCYKCERGDCDVTPISTDLIETCPSDQNDVCLSIRYGVTANGERIKTRYVGCSADNGLRPAGCFGLHELPPSLAAVYREAGYYTLEYCQCDQDLCTNDINFDTTTVHDNKNNVSDNAGSLICNSEMSCIGGDGCKNESTDISLHQTTCYPGIDNACVTITLASTENGQRTEARLSGCGVDFGLGTGCFSLDDLPASAARIYQVSTYDAFEYCICDQDLCNGSTTPMFTLPAIVAALMVFLGTILCEI